MDIDKLKRKRQHNVEEQCALKRCDILNTALAYRSYAEYLDWVRPVLKKSNLDPDDGILLSVAMTPCGGGEEATYLDWLTKDGQFYSIGATINRESGELWLETVKNVTESTDVNCHLPGTGKSFGCLAYEVMKELEGTID